ncbi:MAG: hypothetical protein NVS1B14_00280 [Vulcanimicrobiaceae bacterium]
MEYMWGRKLFPAMLIVGLLVPVPAPTFAQGTATSNLSAILARLAADPATPAQYQAQVRLHVRLRVFPWVSITLNGDSAYKRPGLYHFVFRGVPKAAEHFSDLAYDLGNAGTWPQKYEIALLSPGSFGNLPVLRLTPKRRGMVRSLDVTVDLDKGHIIKAVWNRFDGGVISLVQHYNVIGTHEIVAEQDASIDIPHMKAQLAAEYSGFTLGGSSQK